MQISQYEKDEMIVGLRKLGFTSASEKNGMFQFQNVVVYFTAARMGFGDTKLYTVSVRNDFNGNNWAGRYLGRKVQPILDIAEREIQLNEALAARRNKLCEEIAEGCRARRLEVDFSQKVDSKPSLTSFTLSGWKHNLFYICYDTIADNFYVSIPCGTLDDCEEAGQYPWVETVDDVVAHAKRVFMPKQAVHSQNMIQTLQVPAEWLYWMFVYGFDSLSTYKHETRRESDNQIVNALLPEETEVVTLSAITFCDDIPQSVVHHRAERVVKIKRAE